MTSTMSSRLSCSRQVLSKSMDRAVLPELIIQSVNNARPGFSLQLSFSSILRLYPTNISQHTETSVHQNQKVCDAQKSILLYNVIWWIKLPNTARFINKYECTMDQELYTVCYPASASPLLQWRHGRHLESMTPCQKSDSVNRCVFS